MKKRILTLFALCAALILLTSGAQAEGGPAVETVHVETPEQLMDFLTDGASNRVIQLEAKDYVIYSTYTNASGDVFQSGFSAKNLSNVTIQGQAGTQILTPSDCGAYAVVTLTNCQNVTLDTISFGHQAESCDSTVLQLTGSTGVEILNCDLWGCGNSGIVTYGNTSFHAENTTIRDCSQFITRLDNCTATFNTCKFLRNGGDSKPYAGNTMTAALQGSPVQVVFNNCDFTDNDCSFKIESGQADKYQFNNCTETNNTWQKIDSSAIVVDLTNTASMTLNQNTGEAVISGAGSLSYLSSELKPFITSVEIGTGIESTGMCFVDCPNLETVSLPDTLITFGMFQNATKLKEITIPDSVTNISSSALSGCTSLTTLVIPDGVTSIGAYAFSGCTSLTSVNIPDRVTAISDGVFSGCTGLTSIDIPSRVTSIGSSAFANCTGLIKADIPGSVTDIQGNAFIDCTGLTELTIPDSVTAVGSTAFSGCTGLKKLVIPPSVGTIGYEAFAGCTGLEELTLPASLNYENAFRNCECKNMRYVRITAPGEMPGSSQNMPWNSTEVPCAIELEYGITKIGNLAFSRCKGLTRLDIPNSVTAIGLSAFNSCPALTKVTIPDSVTRIDNYAFSSCKALKEITIPASVTSIGDSAFSYCTALEDIYYGGTAEQWKNAIKPDTFNYSPNVDVHYETSASEHTSSALDQVLTEAASLTEVKTGLSSINQSNLSEAMLESDTLQRISTAEGGPTAVQVSTPANLGFAAGNTTVTGAKVNFPEVADVSLKLDAPSDGTITVPPAEKELRFSASLVNGGTELDAGSLAVPVAITILLPDEDIKPKSVRVWHSKNNSTQEIIYTSLAADGRTLTFVTPGFSDFIITYDTPKPFSASLLSTGLTVTVVDEKETLKENCQTVYAALYDTSGKLADLVSGTLSGNRITFSKPLTNDYFLFFLDSESAPLESKTSLA